MLDSGTADDADSYSEVTVGTGLGNAAEERMECKR
jgi:hypothetical protein